MSHKTGKHLTYLSTYLPEYLPIPTYCNGIFYVGFSVGSENRFTFISFFGILVFQTFSLDDILCRKIFTHHEIYLEAWTEQIMILVEILYVCNLYYSIGPFRNSIGPIRNSIEPFRNFRGPFRNSIAPFRSDRSRKSE